MKRLAAISVVLLVSFNLFAQDKSTASQQKPQTKSTSTNKDSLKKAYKADSIKVKKKHREKF
ncbi:MAG TPA: hypothetical protein VK783_11680 [Bacteroidia bacterium]|jgi:hypothetical protein|nr:hypothetical protein [Bacteroidia bacterium]